MSDDDVPLFRIDKEAMVLELYKQGKSRREIASIVRMNFSDIKIIIDRKFGSKDEKKSKSTDSVYAPALKLFLGKAKPVSVAVKLGLSYDETRKIYLQFLKLNRMHRLSNIYDELGEDGIKPFVALYHKMQENNFSFEQVEDAIELVDSLSELDERRSALRNEVNALESKGQELTSSNTALFGQIGLIERNLNFYNYECEMKKSELSVLNSEVNTRRRLIQDLDSDEGMTRMREVARKEAGLLLQNNYALIAGTVIAVLEAIRLYPAIQELIFQLLMSGPEPFRGAWVESHRLELIRLSEIIQSDISGKISKDIIHDILNSGIENEQTSVSE